MTATNSIGAVAACVKWVDLHPETDVANGVPRPSEHSWGFSEADRAAFEVAMRLAEAARTDAVLVCAGPVNAKAALRELAASGASRAVLIEHPMEAGPGTSGAVLAGVLGAGGLGAHTVVCGDMSNGRGSGSVPAILAHHLGAAQALGLLEVSGVPGDRLRAVRRLDGARREVIEVTGPAVLSVEGSVAHPRRAPLPAILGATAPEVEVITTGTHHAAAPLARVLPWRPPPRQLPAPRAPDAFGRVLELTGALTARTPPRTVEASPTDAAKAILDQLRSWGYLSSDQRVDNTTSGDDPGPGFEHFTAPG